MDYKWDPKTQRFVPNDENIKLTPEERERARLEERLGKELPICPGVGEVKLQELFAILRDTAA